MSNKAGFICFEGCTTVCGIINDALSVIAYLVAVILFLPLLPFIWIASAICPSKADPERDGLISKERNERESREGMDAYFDRLGKDKNVDLRL